MKINKENTDNRIKLNSWLKILSHIIMILMNSWLIIDGDMQIRICLWYILAISPNFIKMIRKELI